MPMTADEVYARAGQSVMSRTSFDRTRNSPAPRAGKGAPISTTHRVLIRGLGANNALSYAVFCEALGSVSAKSKLETRRRL